MTFSYSENIIKCATDGLEKPSDFGYWGPEDMFETWGFCGIDKSRDSSVLDISNFDYISKKLMKEFPSNFRVETYRHWATGSATRLVCQILHRKGEIEDKNITDAFRKAMEWLDNLAEYPVANEDDYLEKKHQRKVDNLPYSDAARIINKAAPDWANNVVLQMYDNGIYWDAEDEFNPADDEILTAAYQLSYWDVKYYQEWFDWTDKNNLPRPPFDLQSMSYWNKNQGKFF
jgi:hypothetical protein